MLCRGFVDAFAARGSVDDWKVAVAEESLRLLDDAKDGKISTPEECRDRVLSAGQKAVDTLGEPR